MVSTLLQLYGCCEAVELQYTLPHKVICPCLSIAFAFSETHASDACIEDVKPDDTEVTKLSEASVRQVYASWWSSVVQVFLQRQIGRHALRSLQQRNDEACSYATISHTHATQQTVPLSTVAQHSGK